VIAATYQPISPSTSPGSPSLDPNQLDPPSFVLYASPHVIAFLDIMPLTRGHVLVAPRKHRIKVGDLSSDEMGEIGRVLPLIARSVMKTVLPDIPHADADYNIVQNNGPGAAQVVPHVHFHIIPRPPFNYVRSQIVPREGVAKARYPPNPLPTSRKTNAIIFGRGTREDLDYDEAEILVDEMRRTIKDDLEANSSTPSHESSESRTKRGDWKV
jgi:diadenosine tetraphosphate (Ap4A) HIT family hydrolase